ncbi:MAG: ABC transporter ATP-binding protein [Dehalococcoidia bacterium]|jgi:ABC-2 type transport system ATP-binding protein|nr:ABC transporter ATP-binding protein [Dehalococcoidia bacterium]
MHAIRIEQLTKDYGPVVALNGLDLTVEEGEVFGFLGPNGSGKTTTLRILMDLIRPTSGRAEILGFDTQRQSIEVRARIGYLPDDPQMYDDMNVHAFLRLMASLRGADGGNGGRPRHEQRRDELIERLQLDPTRRIGALSRGNRQKVGIVLALMFEPPLVVADEPTTGLDPLVREEVELILREIAQQGGTVFFSSHVLGEVEQVCDRVAMLREGRVIDVLVPAERRRLAPQRFLVSFETAPPAGAFDGLPDVTVVSHDGTEAVLELVAGVDALVKCLANFRVTHLETHEVSLEELFMSYYEPDSSDASPGTAADAAAGGQG